MLEFLRLLTTLIKTHMKHLSTLLFLIIVNFSFAQLSPSFLKEKVDFQTQFQKAQFDNPGLAAEYEYAITKNPFTNKVPYHKRYEAMEQTRQILNQRSAIGGVEWTERGPKNVSGRTRTIMFDPNFESNQKVWTGGISGGLWYNSDVENNGEWQAVNDFWENISVSCLAFDPSNTQNFYAGTGEGWTYSSVRGAGIWQSSNAGTSWSRLESTDNENFYYVQSIKVSSTGRVFASTNSGLYYSDNAGTSWTQAIEGFFGDIELTSDGTLYAAKGRRMMEGTVYKSTNNGDSWTDLMITTDYTERTELASSPSNPDVIYAVSSIDRDISWFKKSIDAGANWIDISIPMYLDQQTCSESSSDFTRGQAWYDLIMKVNPEDEDMVYVGGIDWHKTTNGGSSWDAVSYWTGGCTDYVHADQHEMAFFPGDNSKALVGCDGGIYFINNMVSGFNSELHVNNNYNVTQFYGCAMENVSASNYMLAGAQDNGTQRFTQAGFGTTSQATGGDGGLCFIDQDDSQIQITSYVYNNWRLSTNGGQNFEYYPNTNNGSFINPAAYDSETNILYASSSPDSLFVSDVINDGASGNYLAIENGIGDARISAVKISQYSENVIFIGTNLGQIYRITNANTNPTATNLNVNLPLYSNVSSIDLGESEDKILLTSSNYGVASVWQTTNGGSNWTNIEYNLPDMPIRGCLYNPGNTNQILLATETGVWSINDISTETEWVPSNSGLANVRCDQLIYRNSDKMVAVATYGRGLFTSDIFGTPEPFANFDANSTFICMTDTVYFTDHSTKNPDSWLWTITPNTFSFLAGTNANSQNPIIQFNEIGNYTIELTASNEFGSGNATKTNFIQVNEECPYLMSDEVVYVCEGIFFDNGAENEYSNQLDYTMTFTPDNTDPNAFIKINFTMFDLEQHNYCLYDYLKIYDGPDTSYPIIDRYCGNDSPGEISASNRSLTFKFHSDGASVAEGWRADISCDISNTIEDNEASSGIKVFPNPAKDWIKIELSNLDQNTKLEIIDLMGRVMYQNTLRKNSQIDISNLKEGVYILKFSSKQRTVQQSLIIE